MTTAPYAADPSALAEALYVQFGFEQIVGTDWADLPHDVREEWLEDARGLIASGVVQPREHAVRQAQADAAALIKAAAGADMPREDGTRSLFADPRRLGAAVTALERMAAGEGPTEPAPIDMEPRGY